MRIRFLTALRNMKRITSVVAASFSLLLVGGIAQAASSWNPTLLVNTESFQVIDEGNGTSSIEIRFGQTLNERILFNRTTDRFEFTDDVTVRGNLSGSTLRVDGYADIWGNLAASGTLRIGGTTTLNGNTKVRGNLSGSTLNVDGTAAIQGATTINGATTITGNTKVRGNLSGSTLNVDGNSILRGSLSATGAISTNSNLTINSDQDTNNAVLTFGNQTAQQTILFSHANQRFEFSKDIKVTGGVRASGNLSGSTLTVDGALNLRGVTYNAPTAQGASNTFLKNDGAGNLTWTATSVGNGSGSIRSLHPEYEGAVYFQSGSTAIGQLVASGSGIGDNSYAWTSTQGTMQDYWVKVRVQVPKNFTQFETASGILLRLKTATTNSAQNAVTFRMRDTTGAYVAVSNNAALVSPSAGAWRTVAISGVSGGTYTPLGYITLFVKLAATSAGATEVGNIDLRWSTTTP